MSSYVTKRQQKRQQKEQLKTVFLDFFRLKSKLRHSEKFISGVLTRHKTSHEATLSRWKQDSLGNAFPSDIEEPTSFQRMR
jgi:hypothetical protein